MSGPTAVELEVRRRRPQVGLGDLVLWVVGAAVFFALARGARGFWINLVTKRPVLDFDRVVGVALLAPATLIGARLLRDAIRPADRTGNGRAFAAAWRVAGVAFLAGMALLMSGLVRDDTKATGGPIFGRPQWQIKLCVLGLAIGTIGLLLGVVPARRSRPARPRRGALASVILAGVAGVIVLGFWGEFSIVYLVLIALDAVNHALVRPGEVAGVFRFGNPPRPILFDRSLWPSLDARLASVGIASAVALVACALASGWLSRDLHAPADDRARPRSWAGFLYRLATAISAWVAGAYLYLVGLPILHPPISEGLWTLLGATWTTAVAATFTALAAGLAARGVAGPSDEAAPAPRAPWPAWVRRLAVRLARFAVVVFLSLVILGSVAQICIRGDDLPWWVPFSAAELVGALTKPFEWTTSTAIYLDPNLTPDALVVLGAAVVLLVLTLRLLLSAPRATTEAPIDRIGRDPRLVGRFLGAWLALTGVILTLLPAFFLAGIAALHFTLKAYYP